MRRREGDADTTHFRRCVLASSHGELDRLYKVGIQSGEQSMGCGSVDVCVNVGFSSLMEESKSCFYYLVESSSCDGFTVDACRFCFDSMKQY